MYACMCHSPAMSGCCIHCSLLTANNVIIDVSSGEGHPSHSHWLRLVINKLHALLQQTHMDWASRLLYRRDGCWCNISTDLRLWQHIQAPGAHPAICGHRDQVVGVLSADHIDAVDRVLWEKYIYSMSPTTVWQIWEIQKSVIHGQQTSRDGPLIKAMSI